MAFGSKAAASDHKATMKRAIAGDLGEYFNKAVLSGNLKKNISSFDNIRKYIRKFYHSEDKLIIWLSMVDVAEYSQVELWNIPEFVSFFRNNLIMEYRKRIQTIPDPFIILADMMEQKETLSKETAPVKIMESIRDE